MPPRLQASTRIENENGVTQIIQGPTHSDMDGWRAQFIAAFGTSSEKVVSVEMERIANALRRNGKIDAAELDTVIAILSGQQPKDELEAMIVCQLAVTHALTMRLPARALCTGSIPQKRLPNAVRAWLRSMRTQIE
jgi:hypothetical protein